MVDLNLCDKNFLGKNPDEIGFEQLIHEVLI